MKKLRMTNKYRWCCIWGMLLLLLLSSCSTPSESEQSQLPAESHGIVVGDTSTDSSTVCETEQVTNDELHLNDFYLDRFENFEVGKTGEFWVRAVNSDFENYTGEYIYIAVGENKEFMFCLDEEYYSICSGIYDGITLVQDNTSNKKLILDAKGNDVTEQYVDIDQGEKVLDIFEDSTGTTIWTIKDVDTYDSHATILTAKGSDGTIKRSWDSISTYEIEQLKPLNLATYEYGQSIINVETGGAFTFPNSGNHYHARGVDENGSVYTSHYQPPIGDLAVYSDNGDVIWNIALRNNWEIGNFVNGLIYIKGKGEQGNYYCGFLDKEANYVIDLNLNVTNDPFFIGDYALVECENEGKVKFVTLIDRKGKMLFEPILGSAVDQQDIMREENLHYLAKVNGKNVVLDPLGNTIDAPDYWFLQGNTYRYLNGTYLVIEAGKIVEHTFGE